MNLGWEDGVDKWASKMRLRPEEVDARGFLPGSHWDSIPRRSVDARGLVTYGLPSRLEETSAQSSWALSILTYTTHSVTLGCATSAVLAHLMSQ